MNVETMTGGKYLHWEDMRVRQPPEGYTTTEWWLATKLKRSQVRQILPFADKTGQPFSFSDSGDLYRSFVRSIAMLAADWVSVLRWRPRAIWGAIPNELAD